MGLASVESSQKHSSAAYKRHPLHAEEEESREREQPSIREAQEHQQSKRELLVPSTVIILSGRVCCSIAPLR